MKLLIGNKNYSSWSLRPWLLLKQAGISFEEELLRFGTPDFAARVKRHSPAGRVPVLVDGELAIWDSLAIAEYVAEKFPDKGLWPDATPARALARSICAEMHSGFSDLRSRMTMNCQTHFTNVLFDVKVRREAARIVDIWQDARQRFGGTSPFLFGRFTVADAFFAPVTIRFSGYGVPLPPVAQQYVDTILALPAMQQWIAAAKAETELYAPDEPYRETT
jgi:glutathione S-transferase